MKIECAFNKQKQKKRQNTTQNLSTTYYFSYLDPIFLSLDGPGTQTPTVQYNTIALNSIGISLYESNYGTTPIIRYNNLENNLEYNFYLSAPNSPDLSYNWWGIIDESAINQSIYDSKNDFNRGTVSFQPILTSPNSNAPEPTSTPVATPNQSPATSPTPTSDQTPKSTPGQISQQTQIEIIVGLAIVALILGTALGLLIYLIKRK